MQKAGSVRALREGPCQVETQDVCGEGGGVGGAIIRGHRLPDAQETEEL